MINKHLSDAGKPFDFKSAQGKQALRETNLKGKMAESLVHDLLRESGNEVYKIGYEKFMPINDRVQNALIKNKKVGNKLKSIPDLFVIDYNGNPYLVEVKFRWHPDGHETDIERLKKLKQNWEEAMVVFVNCSREPYFRYSVNPFLSKNGESIISEPLSEFTPFKIPDYLIKKFDELVEKYLKPTLKTPLPKDSSVLDHPFQFLR
ncbi:MAG: hypothetical protein HYT12_04905 [Candidatus Liptonbacteria bacterium]|nr:hypothetical protein [Candidatus Liptonbacteria bacterium]